MRIEVEDGVFGAADALDLMPIIWLGATGRHRVLVPDSPAPLWEAWLGALSPSVAAACRAVLDLSIRLEATEPAKHSVRIVTGGPSDWTTSVPRLVTSDALHLMHRPYRVLLENARADGAFILAMATAEERTFLQGRLDSEWLEFESCGGIEGLITRAVGLRPRDDTRVRCSALFDSDASRPGAPSASAVSATASCGDVIHHYQLSRRAVENYIPSPALERWGRERVPRQLAARRKGKVRAFRRLTTEQQRHFHMKRGFVSPEAARMEPFYAGVSARDRGLLATGFGGRIGQLLARDAFESEMRADDGWTELRPFIGELIQRVR